MTNPNMDTTHSDSYQEMNPEPQDGEVSETDLSYPKIRIQVGLGLALFGYLVFLLGARPSLFGLDRSPVVGFVQISVFLLGLAIISLGGYLTLNALWPEGKKTIAAEIGSRLISTGYVICVFTGMADIFGLGSHPLPNVYFGPLQARGMTLGLMTIAVGFLLMIRFKRRDNPLDASQKTEQPASNNSEDHQPEESDKFNIKLSTLFQ